MRLGHIPITSPRHATHASYRSAGHNGVRRVWLVALLTLLFAPAALAQTTFKIDATGFKANDCYKLDADGKTGILSDGDNAKVKIKDGTPPYSYVLTKTGNDTPWEQFEKAPKLNPDGNGFASIGKVSDDGKYWLWVADGNVSVQKVNLAEKVTFPKPLKAPTVEVVGYSCDKAEKGKVTVTVEEEIGPYTYTLVDSDMGGTLKENDNGQFADIDIGKSFKVQYKNGKGCEWKDPAATAYDIKELPLQDPKHSATPTPCTTKGGGSITVEINPNTEAPVLMELYTTPPSGAGKKPDEGTTFKNLKAGIYNITVYREQDGHKICETNLPDIIVEVSAPPTVTFSAEPATCNGQATGKISASGADKDKVNEYFLDPVGITSPNGDFTGLAAGKYNLTYKVGECQFPEDKDKTIEVEVTQPGPLSLAIEQPPQSGKECPGDPIEYLLAVPGGIAEGDPVKTYSWSRAGGTPEITEQPRLPKAPAGDYTLTITTQKGCIATANANVAGIPAMELVTQVTGQPRCQFIDKSDGSARTARVAVKSISGGTNPVEIFYQPAFGTKWEGPVAIGGLDVQSLPGTMKFKLVDKNGCENVKEVTIGSLNPPAVISIEPADPEEICYGGTVKGLKAKITSGTAPGAKPQWYKVPTSKLVNTGAIPLGLAIPLTPDENDEITLEDLTESTLVYYTIQHDDGGNPALNYPKNCLDRAGVVITVKEPLPIRFDPTRTTIPYLSRSTNPNTGRDSIVLAIFPGAAQEIAVEATTGAIYQTGPTNILAPVVGQDGVFLLNLNESTFYSPENVPLLKNAKHSGRDIRLLPVTVMQEKDGCKSELLTLYISLRDQLDIPNVFSPNGDGINDRWLSADEGNTNLYSLLSRLIPNIEVEVFTRAGVKVWQAKGAQVQEGWDGKTYGGKADLPVGTYYYVIRFNLDASGEGWKPKAGTVTLIR